MPNTSVLWSDSAGGTSLAIYILCTPPLNFEIIEGAGRFQFLAHVIPTYSATEQQVGRTPLQLNARTWCIVDFLTVACPWLSFRAFSSPCSGWRITHKSRGLGPHPRSLTPCWETSQCGHFLFTFFFANLATVSGFAQVSKRSWCSQQSYWKHWIAFGIAGEDKQKPEILSKLATERMEAASMLVWNIPATEHVWWGDWVALLLLLLTGSGEDVEVAKAVRMARTETCFDSEEISITMRISITIIGLFLQLRLSLFHNVSCCRPSSWDSEMKNQLPFFYVQTEGTQLLRRHKNLGISSITSMKAQQSRNFQHFDAHKAQRSGKWGLSAGVQRTPDNRTPLSLFFPLWIVSILSRFGSSELIRDAWCRPTSRAIWNLNIPVRMVWPIEHQWREQLQ